MTFGYCEIAADAAPLHEHHHPHEEAWNYPIQREVGGVRTDD
jgi:hypothetical protein